MPSTTHLIVYFAVGRTLRNSTNENFYSEIHGLSAFIDQRLSWPRIL
jgi:hypothetical protein